MKAKKLLNSLPSFLNVCQCVLVVLWHHDGFTGDVQLPWTFSTGVFNQKVVHERAQCYFATGLVYYNGEIRF